MILVKEEVVDQALDKLIEKNRDALDKAYKQKRGNSHDRRVPGKKRNRERRYNTKRHVYSRRRTRVGKKKNETRTIIVSGFGAQ